MSKDLVSIGITCFNAEETIQRAIDSALNQTYPNVEIIIVDDASSDKTGELVSECAKQHRRIKFFTNKNNQGVAAARNKIIDVAEGEYIVFFDDDDYSFSVRLERQLELLNQVKRQCGGDIFCYCDRYVVKPYESRVDHIAYGLGRGPTDVVNAEEVLHMLMIGVSNRSHYTGRSGEIGCGTLMARKKTLKELGGFDARFRRCAEWDLAVRAVSIDGFFVSVTEPLLTQYKTKSPEKKGKVILTYLVLLRQKNKALLLKRKIYLASICSAYVQYYGSKGPAYKAILFRWVSYFLAPKSIFYQKIKKNLKRWRRPS